MIIHFESSGRIFDLPANRYYQHGLDFGARRSKLAVMPLRDISHGWDSTRTGTRRLVQIMIEYVVGYSPLGVTVVDLSM